jgi:hypothetical protein
MVNGLMNPAKIVPQRKKTREKTGGSEISKERKKRINFGSRFSAFSFISVVVHPGDQHRKLKVR